MMVLRRVMTLTRQYEQADMRVTIAEASTDWQGILSVSILWLPGQPSTEWLRARFVGADRLYLRYAGKTRRCVISSMSHDVGLNGFYIRFTLDFSERA